MPPKNHKSSARGLTLTKQVSEGKTLDKISAFEIEERVLPLPDEIGKYENYIHNFGERYFHLIEKTSESEILLAHQEKELAKTRLDIEHGVHLLERRAQTFSLLIVLLSFILAFYALYEGHTNLVAIIFGSSLLGLVTILIKGRKKEL